MRFALGVVARVLDLIGVELRAGGAARESAAPTPAVEVRDVTPRAVPAGPPPRRARKRRRP